jgi:hypothetical protein
MIVDLSVPIGTLVSRVETPVGETHRQMILSVPPALNRRHKTSRLFTVSYIGTRDHGNGNTQQVYALTVTTRPIQEKLSLPNPDWGEEWICLGSVQASAVLVNAFVSS